MMTARMSFDCCDAMALRLRFLAIMAACAMGYASGAAAQATLTVTKTADSADGTCDADCSLREALIAANATAEPNVIQLGAGTYSLTIGGMDEDFGYTGDLDARSAVTIQGAGASLTVIDGGGIDRVLHAIGSQEVSVVVADLTVRGGYVYSGSFPGGGGGLFNQGARLVLERVVIEGNTAEIPFGVSLSGGAGVSTHEGTTLITDSTIARNQYNGPLLWGGGGVFGYRSEIVVDRVAVYENVATGRGAGLMNLGGSLWITNSTVSDNRAVGDGGLTKVSGGGIFTDDGYSYVSFCTVVNNSSSDNGGGIAHDGTRVELLATIIAGNHAPVGTGPDCLQGPFGDPMIVTLGYNLVGDASQCATFAPGMSTDIVGDSEEPADPGLLALADNGGATRTRALSESSIAVDAIADLELCPATDQRGLARPFGAGCDIGSFELTPTRLSGTVTGVTGAGISNVTLHAAGTAGTFECMSGPDGAFDFGLLPAGTYTVTATKPGFTFSPPQQATIPPSVTNLDIRGYDRPPIVLVAGFSSAYGTAFPPASSALAAGGYYVHEADLVNLSDGRVPLLEANVAPLIAAIDHVKTATGQPKIILLAHSMGGLVCRAYVEGPAYASRRDVEQLFTFGSPHLGISELWSEIVPLLASGLTAGTLNSGTVCSLLPGFCQMSKSSMVLFNTIYQRAPGVDYHALGGDAPLGHKKTIRIGPFRIKVPVPDRTWHNALGLVISLMIPGPDDAFIETPSSLGLTGAFVDRFRTNEVHDPAFGHRAYFSWGGSQSAQTYASCLSPLLVTQTSRTCGARQAPLPPATSSDALLAQSDDEALWLDDDRSAVEVDELLAGATVTRTVYVPAGIATLSALWTEGPHDLTLISPSGLLIQPTDGDGELVQYDESEDGASYVLADAEAGAWQIVVRSRAAAPDAQVATFAVFASPVDLAIELPRPDRPWHAMGSIVLIRAVLSELPAAAEAEARVMLADGSETSLALEPELDGTFAGLYRVGDVPGLARVVVVARGSLASGDHFELERRDDFLVMADDPMLTGLLQEQLVPRADGSGLYDALRIEIGVSTSEAQSALVTGDLRAPDGTVVAHATNAVELEAGDSVVSLTFAGADLFRASVNGRLTLTHLRLIDRGALPPVPSLDEDDVFVTSELDYRWFAADTGAPLLDPGGPYSVEEGGEVLLRALAIDPQGDALTTAWDLDGDGVFEATGSDVLFDALSLDGPTQRTVAVAVRDAQGQSATAATTIDVQNVAPSVDAITAGVVPLGETFSLPEVSFFDPGLMDVHTATIDWGDGSALEQAAVAQRTQGGSVTASHTYGAAGSYDAELCVYDDDAGAGCRRFEVSVSRAPDCSAARPSVAQLWPPDHRLQAITIEGVIDADGESVAITIDDIFQDEPVGGGFGTGHTAPDATGVGTSIAQLRAERSGNGNGRVYHVGFSARDVDGLSCTGNVTVSVPRHPHVPARDDGALYDATAPAPHGHAFKAWLIAVLRWLESVIR